MRHILIDTDTGSDDVWAIIAALRATEDVHVDAITVVCVITPPLVLGYLARLLVTRRG